MALDVYVGGFARYYSREWENVVQKHCRETGKTYQQISPGGEPQAADWKEVESAVGGWIDALNGGLGSNLPEPLGWDESRDAPYFTDRPGYEGYGALSLWAAYAEVEKTPPTDFPENWLEDEVYLKAVGNFDPEAKSLRVIHSTQVWLPGDFRFSFDCQDLTGEPVHIASSAGLLECLEAVNEHTFQLNEEDKAEALKGDFAEEPKLEEWARYGFAVFEALARKAEENRLPMFLDQ